MILIAHWFAIKIQKSNVCKVLEGTLGTWHTLNKCYMLNKSAHTVSLS